MTLSADATKNKTQNHTKTQPNILRFTGMTIVIYFGGNAMTDETL